jgi:hypothetical protein
MARKTQTKLLKMVCKRAEAMRVPYRYSPWTSQCNQTNKTSLSTNNTNKKIQSIKSNTVKCQKNMTKNSQGIYKRTIQSKLNYFLT